MNQAAPDLVGRTVLGRYRVVRAIGRGGMGVIYLARSEGAAGFVKPFVIKQAAPEVEKEDTMIAQLAREARIMSNLRHPNIVGVIDFAAEGRSYLLVLDYVQGYNLGQWRKFVQHSGREFSAELAIHIVASVLDALDYAHRLTRSDGEPLDIVHRDVSPGNVLLDVEGHVKLADFGVARMSSDHTSVTESKTMKGKISYMAPELFAHEAPTPSSDVYACAVMLHELLVGRNEFKADTVQTTAIRVLRHVPSYVSAVRSDVPGELDSVLQRALAKSPGERFSSARELADALNRLRTLSSEDAARLLAGAVKQDFNDPRMADLLGVDDPTTLDRAWRDIPLGSDGPTIPLTLSSLDPNVPVYVDEAVRGPTPPSVPTVAEIPVALAANGPRRAPWSIILGVAGLLAGAGALLLALRSQRAAQDVPERVIVVDSRAGTGTAAAGVESAVEAPKVAPSSEPETATSSAAPVAGTRSGVDGNVARDGNAEALSRVVARRQGQIAQCFATRATDVSGTPGLSVRFEVDASGRVLSAHVLPPAVAATPLGECIESVARQTEFGPQPRALSFRIPMTAHRSQ